MANHKSAAKAHRRSLKRKVRNSGIKSRVKTFINQFKDSLGHGLEKANMAFRTAESEIMKSVSKGVLHRKTASRKVSRLARSLKSLEA
jgi:small subunit ribosomal protein S20